MFLFLIGAAFGASFSTSDTPASMNWEFSYTAPIFFTDDTVFTFDETTVDISTKLCAESLLCMEGDFDTEDGGPGPEGPFATGAFRDACSDSSPPAFPMFIEVIPRTCDVIQTVDLSYVYTGGFIGPEYSGEAYAGELDEFEVYLCFMGSCTSFGFYAQSFTADPMDFSGSIGGMGGFVSGTFIEL